MPMMLGIIIFHFIVAEPCFWDIIFESGTHCGDSFGSSPVWMEESVSSEEIECLREYNFIRIRIMFHSKAVYKTPKGEPQMK